MSRKFLSFPSHLAKSSFWTLLFGFLVIQVAALFIFTTYSDMHRVANPKRIQNEVVHVVGIARKWPVSRLKIFLTKNRYIHRGLFIHMRKKPSAKGQDITSMTKQQVEQLVSTQPYDLKLDLQLSDGQWLHVRTVKNRMHPWLLMGLIFSALALLMALIFLCYTLVQRLSMPVRQFADAAKRFGMDVQSPPLAVVGSEEVQSVVKAFNEMQERVRRLLHDRTQMLAAISHDLRTPLTRLRLRVEYLQGNPQYEKAEADLNEMERMISSILSFAKDHVREEAMERFDLNALLEGLCDDMVDAGHQCVYQGPGQRLAFVGRVHALKRVFSNLIENAIKYGKVAEVSLQQKGEDMQITVQDQGPGIPETEMKKVFAPFYRVDPSRSPQTAGTGLGLAVARDIVFAAGGNIELRNVKPRGLCVTVCLPIVENQISPA